MLHHHRLRRVLLGAALVAGIGGAAAAQPTGPVAVTPTAQVTAAGGALHGCTVRAYDPIQYGYTGADGRPHAAIRYGSSNWCTAAHAENGTKAVLQRLQGTAWVNADASQSALPGQYANTNGTPGCTPGTYRTISDGWIRDPSRTSPLLWTGLVLSGTATIACNPTTPYYLALGDSVTFGFEEQRLIDELQHHTYNVNTFGGFVAGFSYWMHLERPWLQTVNIACPGETSGSYFVAGQCPFLKLGVPLHQGYYSSQRDAALYFLRTHPGQVTPITLGLGANDLLGLRDACHNDPACLARGLPGTLATVHANLERAVSELQAAAPGTQIILLQYYNPLAVDDPTTDVAAQQMNAVIAQVASAHHAATFDSFTLFNRSGNERQTLCANTNYCTPLKDIHPNDSGYATMGWQIWLDWYSLRG